MLTPTLSKPRTPLLADDEVTVLAVVLADEFGAPFRFYDALGGQQIPADGAWGADDEPLTPAAVLRLAAEGRPAVSEDGDGYRLTLVVFEGGLPILVAAGAAAVLAPPAERPASASGC